MEDAALGSALSSGGVNMRRALAAGRSETKLDNLMWASSKRHSSRFCNRTQLRVNWCFRREDRPPQGAARHRAHRALPRRVFNTAPLIPSPLPPPLAAAARMPYSLSTALPAGTPSRISVSATSARPRSIIRYAIIEPTNPPPTTVTLLRIMPPVIASTVVTKARRVSLLSAVSLISCESRAGSGPAFRGCASSGAWLLKFTGPRSATSKPYVE
jgi:hypothetical protein